MENGHGYEYPKGYKLNLPPEERDRRRKRMIINRKNQFVVDKELVARILFLLETFQGKEVAEMCNVSRSVVSRIKNKKHVSPIPESPKPSYNG